MRSNTILGSLALAALTATAFACSKAPAPEVKPPAFVDDTGEAANALPEYPPPPYGISIGSVVQNYLFVGYPNASASTASMAYVQLADFYNPHGKDPSYTPPAGQPDDRLFPTTSGYELAGKPKPTVLLLDIASVWCGPCNDEAGTILPAKHAQYLPCGGEFMLQLADNEYETAPQNGPATPKNLVDWTKMYKVDFPAVIDPTYKLEELWALNAFPENIIIDTTTMKIAAVQGGEAIATTCGDVSICTTDSDCQSCQGICSDQSGYCQTNADCPSGVTCGGFACGDGTSCTSNADCAAKKCTTAAFWATYESLLDKTRAGCTVQ
jgi:hypothetical protein